MRSFHISRPMRIYFLRSGWGGGGAGNSWLCDHFGHWSVHCFGNISTEYYTVRTASSGVSSNQGLARRERSLKISKNQ